MCALRNTLHLMRSLHKYAPACMLSMENPARGKFEFLPCVCRMQQFGFQLREADHCMMATDIDHHIFTCKPTVYLLANVRDSVPLRTCDATCAFWISPDSRRHMRVCWMSKELHKDQHVVSDPVLQGLIPLGLFQTLWNNRCRFPDKARCSVYRPTDLAAQLQDVGGTDADWSVADRHMVRASYSPAELWHQRFAHLSGRRLKGTVRHVAGLPADLPQKCSEHCTTCAMTQQKFKPVPKVADHRLATATRLSNVSWDLHGPYATEGVSGARYVAVAVDAETAHTWVDVLPDKKPRTVAKSFTRYCCQVGVPGSVTTDNGQEFGRLFRDLCD